MKKSKIGYFFIASAIIWGAVILGCAFALRGSDGYSKIQMILYIGVVSHLLFIWGPMNKMMKEK